MDKTVITKKATKSNFFLHVGLIDTSHHVALNSVTCKLYACQGARKTSKRELAWHSAHHPLAGVTVLRCTVLLCGFQTLQDPENLSLHLAVLNLNLNKIPKLKALLHGLERASQSIMRFPSKQVVSSYLLSI